jgi:hypothetical protein
MNGQTLYKKSTTLPIKIRREYIALAGFLSCINMERIDGEHIGKVLFHLPV